MMSLVVMPLTTAVALFLPSGLTFYFFLSSLLHTLQTYFLHQQWFRRLIGLKPLTVPVSVGEGSWQAPRIVDMSAPRITSAQRAAAPVSESMFGSIQSTLADAREKLNERSDRSAMERSQKAAREYDEKRALEEKEKILARLQQKRVKDERY